MEVIDNFLPPEEFRTFQESIMGQLFPWFFNEYTLSPTGNYFDEDKDSFQFTHMMYKQNLGQNKGKKFTSFLNIQQVNKGGTFVGSNKLKHMTTGMMEIRFVDERTQDERYVVFSKNRRGHVGKQMFFDLSAAGDVTYDTERFKKAESLKQLKKKEKELIKKDGLEFDKLFGLKDEVSE